MKPSFPKLKPTKYDALLVLAILALTVALGARTFLEAQQPQQTGGLSVAVEIDGAGVERGSLADFCSGGRRVYENNGYALTVEFFDGTVNVVESTCPTQLCKHTHPISRAGQSIVCLPARIVISLVGTADYDVIAG